MTGKLRVLVVDDSTVFRKIVRDSLAKIPSVEVVGHAANGSIGLDRIAELKPDLVTLDIEMPEMSGLEVLKSMKSRKMDTAAIMVSSLTSTGARSTTQALALGAFDLILKPCGSSLQENVELLRSEFEPKIEALLKNRQRSTTAAGKACHVNMNTIDASKTVPAPDTSADQSPNVVSAHAPAISGNFATPQIVVIGTSTGGPAALTQMLPMLPADLPVPVLIVQHMPRMFTKTLADDLNRSCALEVKEAVGGEKICAGQVYIAPGGRHMKVLRTSNGVFLRVTDDPPVLSCRPSVDYLFRSVNKAYENVLAVIMTGMGDDGSRSLAEMKSANVKVIAQDEPSSVVYGMPRCVVEQGNADIVCPLDSIAGAIGRTTRRRPSTLPPTSSQTPFQTQASSCN